MRKGRSIAVMSLLLVAGLLTVIAQESDLGLPEDIAGYFGWQRANVNKSLEESAHPIAKDIYYNDEAAQTITSMSFPYAEGSIFIKESLDPEGLMVNVITAMRKVEGFNPDEGDWQYGMFERQEDNSFSGDWMNVEGASGCIGCHANAEDTDYTFLSYLRER